MRLFAIARHRSAPGMSGAGSNPLSKVTWAYRTRAWPYLAVSVLAVPLGLLFYIKPVFVPVYLVLIRLRLVVTRKGEQDVMTLRAEAKNTGNGLCEAVGSTLQAVTKLRGAVEVVAPGTLPNDGKVIADERPVG